MNCDLWRSRGESLLMGRNFVSGICKLTRSSADADNLRDAFRGQSRSTNMVPFWVRCDFSLSMWPAPRITTV